jgi:hypothetical protein
MIQTSPTLFTLLQTSSEFIMADLITIITNTGNTLRYTSTSFDLILPGFNLLPGNIGYQTVTSSFAGITLGTTSFDQSTFYMSNPTWQCTTSATSGQGILTNGISLLPNTKYLATGLILAPKGASMNLVAGDSTYNGETSFTATGIWEQIIVTFTTGTSPMVDAIVGFVTNSATATTFNIANLQIMEAEVPYSSTMRTSRGPIKVQTGTEVDSLDITFYPRNTDVIGTAQFLTAIRTGALDNAIFGLERAFFAPIDWNAYLANITGPPVPTYVDKICRFKGFVCEIDDWSATEVPVTVKSALMLLDLDLPRAIYQSQCRNTLFDSGCKLLQSNYAVNVNAQQFSTPNALWITPQNKNASATGLFEHVYVGTGDGSSTDFSITLQYVPTGCQALYFNLGNGPSTTLTVTDYNTDSSIPFTFNETYEVTISETSVDISFPVAPTQGTVITADFPYTVSGYYDLGTVVSTNGANIGFVRTIKQYQPFAGNGTFDILQFALAFPYPIAVGDNFTIFAGCDKIMSTCSNKFNNIINFAGEPFIPCPETAA